MRDTHYVRMCFKSVKTLGVLHSKLSTAENVEILVLYPIHNLYWCGSLAQPNNSSPYICC